MTDIARVQQRVDSMFDRLHKAGMVHLSALNLRASLHPGEWCSLQESGTAEKIDPNGYRLSLDECVDARSGAWSRAGRSQSALNWTLESDDTDQGPEVGPETPCWLLSPGHGSEWRRPECTPTPENLAVRRGMLKRFKDVAAGPASSSHLRFGPLLYGFRVVFYGDSLVRELFQAARCDAVRSTEVAIASKQLQLLSVYAWRAKPTSTPRATVQRALSSLVADGGGMFVASMGQHYNNFFAPKTGLVEAFDVHTRPQLNRELAWLIEMMEAFAARGRNHSAVLLTPALQHFNTSDGTFALSVFNDTGHACRQATTSFDALSRSSANYWRVADMLKHAQEKAPHVLVVPQHKLSEHWWDHHAGGSNESRSRSRGKVSKSTTDCTHFCYDPFLYEPLWWALRQLTIANHDRGA